MRVQQLPVLGRREIVELALLRQLVGVLRRMHQPADDAVDRLLVVHRRLHGQHSPGPEEAQQPGNQMRMVRYPLDARVGEDHVETAGQLAQLRGHVAQPKIDVRIGFARRFDHVGRTVDAENLGVRVAFAQHGRAVARPAADVEHAPDTAVVRRQLHRQITRRLRALLLESQILFRIPGNHATHAIRTTAVRPSPSQHPAFKATRRQPSQSTYINTNIVVIIAYFIKYC